MLKWVFCFAILTVDSVHAYDGYLPSSETASSYDTYEMSGRRRSYQQPASETASNPFAGIEAFFASIFNGGRQQYNGQQPEYVGSQSVSRRRQPRARRQQRLQPLRVYQARSQPYYVARRTEAYAPHVNPAGNYGNEIAGAADSGRYQQRYYAPPYASPAPAPQMPRRQRVRQNARPMISQEMPGQLTPSRRRYLMRFSQEQRGHARNSEVWNRFYRLFTQCRTGALASCEPLDYYSKRHRHEGGDHSCHGQDRAIDVGAISCNGVAYGPKTPEFHTIANCIKAQDRPKREWTNQGDSFYRTIWQTRAHYDHFHFGIGCSTKHKDVYW